MSYVSGFESGKGGTRRGCFCSVFSRVNQHFVLSTDLFEFEGSGWEKVWSIDSLRLVRKVKLQVG